MNVPNVLLNQHSSLLLLCNRVQWYKVSLDLVCNFCTGMCLSLYLLLHLQWSFR